MFHSVVYQYFGIMGRPLQAVVVQRDWDLLLVFLSAVWAWGHSSDISD